MQLTSITVDVVLNRGFARERAVERMPGIGELLLALLGRDVADHGLTSVVGGFIDDFADLRYGALDIGSHRILRFFATGRGTRVGAPTKAPWAKRILMTPTFPMYRRRTLCR